MSATCVNSEACTLSYAACVLHDLTYGSTDSNLRQWRPVLEQLTCCAVRIVAGCLGNARRVRLNAPKRTGGVCGVSNVATEARQTVPTPSRSRFRNACLVQYLCSLQLRWAPPGTKKGGKKAKKEKKKKDTHVQQLNGDESGEH